MVEQVKKPQKTASRRLFEFLGSMELAITLLVAVAIASVIGTILQQNQAYNDYVIKFGPFWFELFEKMSLYDVYSAVWFLVVLGFLILSTSVCVYKNTPVFLREIQSFRTSVQYKSLKTFKHQRQWQLEKGADDVSKLGEAYLHKQGFKSRVNQNENRKLVASKKGGINRWGYVLTHVGMIIIFVGGLLDSKIPLMISEWKGELKPETRNIPASQVPDISRISPSNNSFRGNVQIPEKGKANIVFLNIRDGYVVQELPFAIELKDFRVEHYSTGAPKSFESDLIIHDDKLEKPLEATIAVNHPLIYRGYALYQASFADGGSKLDLKLWSLRDKPGTHLEKKSEVFDSFRMTAGGETLTAEMGDFRLFNVNQVATDEGKTDQRNLGPSITFKLRDESGAAKEFVNYMLPVESEGVSTYISGVRSDLSQPFRYLHLPVAEDGVGRFMKLLETLSDPDKVFAAADLTVQRTMGKAMITNQKLADDVANSMVKLVAMFMQGGYEAVVNDVKARVKPEQQKDVTETYLKLLQSVVSTVYQSMLEADGKKLSEQDWVYFDIALQAINTLPYYGAPVYFELASFEQIQAAGIQITRSPGQDVVYFGCVLLMVGVFLLFYVNPTRYWLWINEKDGKTEVLLAGTSHRQTRDFDRQFEKAADELQQYFLR